MELKKYTNLWEQLVNNYMINKKTIKSIFVITLTFILSIILVILLTKVINIVKYKTANYYIIENEKIPSIYKIIGKRNLYYYSSYEENNSYIKEFRYKNIDNVKSDINNYINELRSNYNYLYTSNVDLTNDENSIELSTNSQDKNKIIILNIDYNKDSYIIKITKGPGKINIFN